jgi:LmbE family N-acetylglucosaminyl deacetylase
MAQVLLVVVAHPDDETFGTGSLIAHAAARGVRVVVCCATRGEAGEDISGTTSSTSELAQVREGELRAAAKVLGVSELVVLDFPDSGMTGDMPKDALAAVDLETVIAPVAAVIERVQPDMVVALDPIGVDDHRDHIRIGTATETAFRRVAKPDARLYYWTVSYTLMHDWLDEIRAVGLLDAYIELDLGRPDAEITTVLDTCDTSERTRAAIAEHRTQQTPYTGLSDELMNRLLCSVELVRVVPPWTGGPVEHELFREP